MQLNDRQQLILLGVLQDQGQLATMDPAGAGISHGLALGAHRLRIRHARAGLVPMNLANWIGHAPTNSECVMFHREYTRLEGMGLIERCNLHGGRRTSHLKLTPRGRRVAEELLAEEDALNGTDQTIDWSKVEFLPIKMPTEADDADEGQESVP